MWPIEIAEARYAPFAPDLPLNTLGLAEPVQAVLRLRLRAAAPFTFDQLALDRLNLFLAAGDEVALKLYELILGSGLGVFVAPPARPAPWFEWLGREAIQPVGFAREQALIPYTSRSFSGYRLLHEYFAFPERFRFVELAGLRKALARHGGDEIELVIPLARSDGALGALVDKGGFALHCTPAVNLFARRADRIHVSDQQAEHHVVVDRTKPMDFEVYSRRARRGIQRSAGGRAGVSPVLRLGRRGRNPSRARLLHDAARAACALRAPAPRRPADQLHRQRGLRCRSSIRARRRTRRPCASSRSTCWSPTATCPC